jgi:secreted PhoX family phosphatase
MPLPAGSRSSSHGLLVVNNEYTNSDLMFPGVKEADGPELPKELADIELAAHGISIVEIRREGGRWSLVEQSRYNRRLTTGRSSMNVAGPAAGHPRLKTSADPTGQHVIGTLNNCAGGVTPWGTVLSGEENFHLYFKGSGQDGPANPEARNHRRYGINGQDNGRHSWGNHYRRFHADQEPNEPNRFGWVVELDPYDPQCVPIKRTALGRMRHEGATIALAPDGRVVVYMGDDARFEYIYKFVSRSPYNPQDRAANASLLDEGTLYVARLEEDGTLRWLPLVYGQGPLVAENRFDSQADVLIETRRAADLVGATPMDRPEDLEANPLTGRVYVALTNNHKRTAEQVHAANPRANNVHGHILELIPPPRDGQPDHAAEHAQWDVFLLGGDPSRPADGAQCHAQVSPGGWVTCPDNIAFDGRGRLWIATDGAPASTKLSDGVFACDTVGPGRALTRLFFQAPRGAEVCGPCFTPDYTTLFVAVQHPGEEPGSTFDNPTTRWPDFHNGMPPRPSVVAITHREGGPIGG